MVGLFEDRAAGLAQARFLSPETGSDGANIGNLAGAQAIDVRRTGPALLGRADGISRTGREQRQKETKR